MDQKQDTERASGTSLKGVFAAALTPMDRDLNVDREAFTAHCRRLLDAGCHGLGVFGTTGEANSLSVEERTSALTELVEDGIPGEKLLPGTGSCALTDAVRLSRAALEVGVGGVLVLPPFYYKGVDDDGLFRFFAELIERVGDDRLRMYLYNFPQMTGLSISLNLIGRLLESYPRVVAGTKDSSGDRERIRTTCKEHPGFDVFAGTERYLLDTLRWGGAGCISATVNVTSRQARQVYDAYKENWEDAEMLQERLIELRAGIEGYPMIPGLKYLMQHSTGEESWSNLRPPLTALSEKQAGDLPACLPAADHP